MYFIFVTLGKMMFLEAFLLIHLWFHYKCGMWHRPVGKICLLNPFLLIKQQEIRNDDFCNEKCFVPLDGQIALVLEFVQFYKGVISVPFLKLAKLSLIKVELRRNWILRWDFIPARLNGCIQISAFYVEFGTFNFHSNLKRKSIDRDISE